MPDDFPDRPAKRSTPRQNTKKVRDTHVRGSIKQHVRLALWAKSAGRCTLCNHRVLNDAKTYLHAIPSGELAHILGAKTTQGSPRGRQELDRQIDLESEDNLILCCHDCHRMIDDEDHVEFFTPTKLREIKRAHEERVELATSDGILTRTAVIRVGSDVRGSYAVASRREVADTLFANGYLGLVESRRSGQFECELPGEATDPGSGRWRRVRSSVRRAESRRRSRNRRSHTSRSSRSRRSLPSSSSAKRLTTRLIPGCGRSTATPDGPGPTPLLTPRRHSLSARILGRTTPSTWFSCAR